MIKTAVVILNYNGRQFLEQFLPNVIAYSKQAEVIVADNASTDNSISFLQNQYPDLSLIRLSENMGYAGGYNEALKQVNYEYLVLLNSDVEVSENWLEPMISFLDKNENYAACQPKIKDFNHQSLFEYAGACGGFIDSLGYPYCRGRIFDKLEIDSGQYNQELDIFWSSGACMMVRKNSFDKAGGLDGDFFAHMEEIDLCWRLNSIGFSIKSIPSSVVYHVGGGTLNKSSPFKTYLNFRNGLYLIVKNLPLSALMIKLPIRIALDWIALLKFLLEANPNHSLAILKAHLSVTRNLIKTLKKRRNTSSTKGIASIVWEFYVRRNKKFSEL